MKTDHLITKKARPRWIKLLYILAIIALTLIILNIVASSIATRKIRNILQKSHPCVTVDFDYTRVNILNRSVKIGGVELKSDTTVPDFRIHINQIKISGIGILRLITGKSASIRKVELKKPEIKGNLDYLVNFKKTDKAIAQDTVSSETKKAFTVHVHKIHLADAKIDSVIIPGVFPFQDIENANIKLYDFDLFLGDDKAEYTLGDAIVEMKKAQFRLPGDYYNIDFRNLHVRMKDSTIHIDSFNLTPNYGKYKFGNVKGIQTDRFEVRIGKLGIHGFDLNSVLKNKGLLIREIAIDGLLLHVFRDKRLPFDYTNFPPLPQQALNKLKFPVAVNDILVSNMFVEYSEINNVSNDPGVIFLDDLKIAVNNFANRQSNPTEANIVINGEGMLLGECPVVVEFILPINTVNDTFYFNGAASELDMAKLNQMVQPLTNVHVTSGNLAAAEFHGSANGEYSGGTFKMLYQDLAFEILKGADVNEPAKPKAFLSFVAGTVVRESNPIADHDPKIVEMYFERDKNKGFFNFFWKSLLSGIKSTALPGHNINKEDKDRQDRNDKKNKPRKRDKKS